MDLRTSLVQLSMENLRYVMNQIPGTKDLILDSSVMKPMDVFAGMAALKSLGVNKVYKFEKNHPTSTSLRVYIVNVGLINAKFIVNHLQHTTTDFICHVIFVPRILDSVKTLFEEEGVYERVKLYSYQWELIPLDDDLLSLEMPHFFKDVFVLGDLSLLPAVTHSLVDLEALFGQIPYKYAVGDHSCDVLKQMELMTKIPENNSDFEYLFLIDRDVDYASCLLSPVTYESLLDEVFEVHCGVIEIDSSTKLQLSNRDKTFAKIRHRHFANIFSYLSVYARQLQQHKEKASSSSTPSEMKNFVQNHLKDLQTQSKAVALHIGASEVIQRKRGHVYEAVLPIEHEILRNGRGLSEAFVYIEEAMARLEPEESVLRLLALCNLCNHGLPDADLDRIRHQFIQSYGFRKFRVLRTLEIMGLIWSKKILSRSTIRPNFQTVSGKLNLIPKNPATLTDISDPSYVFNGAYLPLCSRLIESVLSKREENDASDAVFKSLTQYWRTSIVKPANRVTVKSKYALVYFVGGYTAGEVAALRTLQESVGYQFVVAGTCNITGRSLMQNVISAS